MAQAFAAAESPSAPPETAAQPADATAPPAPSEPPGPIPFDRHKSILDNAYKERDTWKAQVEQYKAQLESPEGQRLRSWSEGYQRNPEQWFAQTITELQQLHPDLVPALRSHAARVLGSRQAPAPAEPSAIEPDIPVYDAQGQLVNQTFSAQRVQQIVDQAVMRAIQDVRQKDLAPIQQDLQQRQQERQTQQWQQEAQAAAAKQLEVAKQWPGFLSDPAKGVIDPDLVKAWNEHPDWTLQDAYIGVIVPKLQQQERATVLGELKTKAAAGQAVTPSGAAVPVTRRPTSLMDKSLQW